LKEKGNGRQRRKSNVGAGINRNKLYNLHFFKSKNDCGWPTHIYKIDCKADAEARGQI